VIAVIKIKRTNSAPQAASPYHNFPFPGGLGGGGSSGSEGGGGGNGDPGGGGTGGNGGVELMATYRYQISTPEAFLVALIASDSNNSAWP
jgi:hypothetical protein